MRTARPGLVLTLGCVGLLGVAGLAGCAKTQAVAIDGLEAASSEPWPATAPRVDISNFNGRVDLVVNERLSGPRVSATAWSCGEKVDARAMETQGQMGVTAAMTDGVYRVAATAGESLPAGVGMHLSVQVPSAGAITVYNRGGPVKIIGATSGVQVENGRGPQTDDDCWVDEQHTPWVQLRTDAPIDQPIALVTDAGDVAIILGPGAKGALDLQAPAGDVRANARVGTFDELKSKHRSLTGRYNGGTNPVLLRTESGNARALMIEKPADYSMLMWW